MEKFSRKEKNWLHKTLNRIKFAIVIFDCFRYLVI